MVTAEERLRILQMVEQRQISAEEGVRLLTALEGSRRDEPASPPSPGSQPRWFRVRVTDLRSGRSKVNVNIPMGLVNVGLKLGARFAPDVEGIDANSIIEMIKEGTRGKLVDVEDDEGGERVEIFVE
jgi:hypothetical protein